MKNPTQIKNVIANWPDNRIKKRIELINDALDNNVNVTSTSQSELTWTRQFNVDFERLLGLMTAVAIDKGIMKEYYVRQRFKPVAYFGYGSY